MAFCDVCNGVLDPDGVCQECREADEPFRQKYLKKGDEVKLLLTIRLNLEERSLLDDIKDVLDLESDGRALKVACFKGWGVLQRTLGRDFLKWLASQDRTSRKLK